MAWIKMDVDLPNHPRVLRLSEITGAIETTIVGGLHWLWAFADQHSVDGRLPGVSPMTIDRKTGVVGFGEALLAVDWLRKIEGGVAIPRFERHNGASAKRRAQEAARMGAKRSAFAAHANNSRTQCARDAQQEKENSTPSSSSTRKPTLAECEEEFARFGGTTEMAHKYFAARESTDWRMRGSEITHWQAEVQTYIAAWKRNEQKGPRNGNHPKSMRASAVSNSHSTTARRQY